jgi:hypothetical protein
MAAEESMSRIGSIIEYGVQKCSVPPTDPNSIENVRDDHDSRSASQRWRTACAFPSARIRS